MINPIIFVVSLLLLLPDIPLSSLEEKKSEHMQLLQERIGQLKQQMVGVCWPPGNMTKRWPYLHVVWNGPVHIHSSYFPTTTLAAHFVTQVADCLGLAR